MGIQVFLAKMLSEHPCMSILQCGLEVEQKKSGNIGNRTALECRVLRVGGVGSEIQTAEACVWLRASLKR